MTIPSAIPVVHGIPGGVFQSSDGEVFISGRYLVSMLAERLTEQTARLMGEGHLVEGEGHEFTRLMSATDVVEGIVDELSTAAAMSKEV